MKNIKYIVSAALVGGALFAAAEVRADEATDQKINDLDQKIRMLERKLEIADENAATKAKESPSLTAGKDGFSLASADKSFQLKLKGFLQTDARFFLDDAEKKNVDTLTLRRARLIFDGTVGSSVSFKIAPDFGGGSTVLQDAYADYKASDLVNLRLGRAKVPFGLERLRSSSETLFNETALSTSLTPGYDTGASLFGSVNTGVLDYAVGVYNGGPDGANVDSDTNDEKDFAARVWLTPFKHSENSVVSGLSFGIAGTYGKQSGNTNNTGLPSFKTSGQQTFFSYKSGSTNSATTAFADGDHTRLSPQLFYVVGPLGVLGEYVISEQDVANGKGSDSIKNDAWQVAVSYVLTGESPSLKNVVPLKPFDRAKGQWGAFELIGRVSELNVDDVAFDKGYADAKKSASSAQNWGAGLNWYVSKNVKFGFNYEETKFDGGSATGDRPTEKLVAARGQVSF